MTVTGMSRTEGADGNVARPPLTDCRARDVLHRVGDKWSVFVIDRLGQGSHRFSELRRSIDGITGRMLTVTLRGLERDGLVARTVHPVIPPRADYELTPLGATRYARRHAPDEGPGPDDDSECAGQPMACED